MGRQWHKAMMIYSRKAKQLDVKRSTGAVRNGRSLTISLDLVLFNRIENLLRELSLFCPKHDEEDLMGRVGQNTVCKPHQELQETFDLSNCLPTIHQIQSLKIMQFSHSVSHSWRVHLWWKWQTSHLSKWDNLHSRWLSKCFFVCMSVFLSHPSWWRDFICLF